MMELTDKHINYFWKRVQITPFCWYWTGTLQAYGRGQFKCAGIQTYAPRAAYVIQNGQIPDGMSVLHHCDVPQCVRGDHLFIGSQQDNIADKMAKGRQAYGNDHHNSIYTQEEIDWIRDVRKRFGWIYRTISIEFNRKFGKTMNEKYISAVITGNKWYQSSSSSSSS